MLICMHASISWLISYGYTHINPQVSCVNVPKEACDVPRLARAYMCMHLMHMHVYVYLVSMYIHICTCTTFQYVPKGPNQTQHTFEKKGESSPRSATVFPDQSRVEWYPLACSNLPARAQHVELRSETRCFAPSQTLQHFFRLIATWASPIDAALPAVNGGTAEQDCGVPDWLGSCACMLRVT
jgi:hypothetical protein